MSEGLQKLRERMGEDIYGAYSLDLIGQEVQRVWDGCQHDADRITELENELAEALRKQPCTCDFGVPEPNWCARCLALAKHDKGKETTERSAK